jgi:hypothetical protein
VEAHLQTLLNAVIAHQADFAAAAPPQTTTVKNI